MDEAVQAGKGVGARVGAEDAGRRRVWIWGAVILAFAVGASLVSATSGVRAVWVVLLILCGCIAAPLQLLVLCNAGALYQICVASARPAALALRLGVPPQHVWAVKAAMCVLFVAGFGVASGLAILINTKFMPVAVQSFLGRFAAWELRRAHGVLDQLVPARLQTLAGWPFTVLSEMVVVPVALAMMYALAQLKMQGECFDVSRGQWSVGSYALDGSASEAPRSRKKRILMVLVHGNRFNESQWLVGKFWMRSRAWAADVEFLSVNMFTGSSMRDHNDKTRSMAQCAQVAFEQVRAGMKERGIEEPERIILMGHSLGCLVSSYINEYLADGAGWTRDRHVVLWSGVLAGSDLFLWLKTNCPGWMLPERVRDHAGHIQDDFLPTAPSTAALRREMARNGRSYFAITGECDHLVRPSSAAFPAVFQLGRNAVVVPYLGHFNIKISTAAWSIVIDHLEKERKVCASD
jgi:hypothetical protein